MSFPNEDEVRIILAKARKDDHDLMVKIAREVTECAVERFGELLEEYVMDRWHPVVKQAYHELLFQELRDWETSVLRWQEIYAAKGEWDW
jgi:hypothetical protein